MAWGYRSMLAALNSSNLHYKDIDYINAHGTSTMADIIELGAVEKLLAEHVPNVTMSSTKSSIGHLLGAAGAVEAIFCILSIRDQIAPQLSLNNIAKETKLDLAPNISVKKKLILLFKLIWIWWNKCIFNFKKIWIIYENNNFKLCCYIFLILFPALELLKNYRPNLNPQKIKNYSLIINKGDTLRVFQAKWLKRDYKK